MCRHYNRSCFICCIRIETAKERVNSDETSNLRITWNSGVLLQHFFCFCGGKAISITYCECNAHAPYCHLSPAPLYKCYTTLSHRRYDFRQKSYWTQNVCFDFVYNFVRNISHSKKKWVRYDQKIYESSCKVPFTWHSEDRASWYILIIETKRMHPFSTLFW